jgi:hypothetical protein
MGVMLDIIVASMIGAVITLIIMNANIVIGQTWATYNGGVMVQQLLISDAQIVEGEFRNMGCGVDSSASNKILQALDTCITFRMALRPDPGSEIKTVKYWSGSPRELSATENPDDRFLYRRENSGDSEKVGMVTKFNIRYFDFQNDTMPTPVSPGDLIRIGIVEITLEVQSPYVSFIDANGIKRYASAMWKQTRLASQNLKR